jgi:hypothetical protein
VNQAIYTDRYKKTSRLIRDRSAQVLGLANIRQALLAFDKLIQVWFLAVDFTPNYAVGTSIERLISGSASPDLFGITAID